MCTMLIAPPMFHASSVPYASRVRAEVCVRPRDTSNYSIQELSIVKEKFAVTVGCAAGYKGHLEKHGYRFFGPEEILLCGMEVSGSKQLNDSASDCALGCASYLI